MVYHPDTHRILAGHSDLTQGTVSIESGSLSTGTTVTGARQARVKGVQQLRSLLIKVRRML